MDYQIEVKNLEFSYGSSRILEDINLGVRRGNFISILGPNGSGKSTLVKNISVLLKPQKGCIMLDGEDILGLKTKKVAEKISVVPQNTSIEFDFKVRDIVMMGRYPHIKKLKGETAKDLEIAEKAMKYTNTMAFADRYFGELSGGEKQRVILAQALAQEPQVLLLDEPISHLDLQHQIEMLDLIKRMSVKSGLTVIAVLHDLNLAAVYSDYIFMVKDKRIQYEGKPHEVLTVESIKDVFNTDVYISVSPVGNKPYIYTITKPYIKKNDIKVHVICGGGSGSETINDLYHNGFEVSTGVLNTGDLDWKISREYDISIAEEVPFGEISEESYNENLKLAKASEYIVLTNTYFSGMNLKNLELLMSKELKERIVIVFDEEGFRSRDYSENAVASFIFEKLKSENRIRCIEPKELCRVLKAGVN